MIILDLYREVKSVGSIFMSLFGIADTHFLCDDEDEDAFQPVNIEYFNYIRYCLDELKDNKKFFGEIITFTGGDLTELEKTSSRDALRSIHKNKTRAQDSIHKRILSHDIYPKLKNMVNGTTFVGGVLGNHHIEFSRKSDGTGYSNSEEYLIKRLGGKYCGDGKMLINLHLNNGKSKCLKRIVITHGRKAGTKAGIINELKDIYYQYGTRVDCIIKAHAHDPFAGFYASYDLPTHENRGRLSTQETLVICLGSTRGGEMIGDTDYTEPRNYTPTAGRFPAILFKATKLKSNNSGFDVKLRPYIM